VFDAIPLLLKPIAESRGLSRFVAINPDHEVVKHQYRHTVSRNRSVQLTICHRSGQRKYSSTHFPLCALSHAAKARAVDSATHFGNQSTATIADEP